MEIKNLLGINSSAKTEKGLTVGYSTAILYLAPSDVSGVMNVCPMASAGCRNACLYSAGRASMARKDGSNPIKEARIRKTVWFKEHRAEFVAQLVKEIEAFVKQAAKKDLIPTVRLNGTSDIAWELIKTDNGKSLMERFPDIQFYDYTKIPKRALKWARGKMPANYHLTFSWNESEANHEAAKEIAAAGGNIAVVFANKNFPATFLGLPVVDADKTDLRFLDDKGVIAALKAKGDATKDDSGFVVRNPEAFAV